MSFPNRPNFTKRKKKKQQKNKIVTRNFLLCHPNRPGHAQKEKKEKKEKQNSDEKLLTVILEIRPSLSLFSCHLLQLSRA